MHSSSTQRETGGFTRLTFALPDHERIALEVLAERQDRNLAQLCRQGVRLVIEAERNRETVAA